MIAIQLLDLVYTDDNPASNIFDSGLATTLQSNWAVNGTTGAEFTPVQSGGTKYMYFVTPPLVDDVWYYLSFKVSNYGGAGGTYDKVGFSSWGSTASNGILGSARRASNGTTSVTFQATGSSQTGGNAAKLFIHSGCEATLSNVIIAPASSINFNYSVMGTLDVGNHHEFPLALTFSISELRDITSRSGTYSKTFKIPATKNNNKIYKAAYITNSIYGGANSTLSISTLKNCRILVDDLYSIVGQLQLTAVGSSSSPEYYSCVFYGNNVDWSAALKDAPLKDLKVAGGESGSGWDTLNGKTGTGLGLNYSGVTSTWTEDDADTGSPIVYPIQDLGQMNVGSTNGYGLNCYQTYAERHSGGVGGKIGYWGWDSSGSYSGASGAAYGTMVPEVDWRPCIWVYDIFKQIFNGVGYSIDSNFIESSIFKTLLLSTPNFVYNNPSDRYALYSMQTTFRGVPTTGNQPNLDFYDTFIGTASAFQYDTKTIKFDNNDTMTVDSNYSNLYDTNINGYFTIDEYGFYDINFENFSIGICAVTDNTGNQSYVRLGYLKIWIEVQTAGESSWNWIATGFALDNGSGGSTKLYYGTSEEFSIDPINIEDRWFNKNDKIRFRLKVKCKGYNGASDYDFKTYVYSAPSITWSSSCAWQGSSSGRLDIKLKKPELPCWGQTYDLKDIINEKYTQIDFIKGIAHAFNLQFTTNTSNRTVTIEPFNDFYLDPSTNIPQATSFGRFNTNGSIDWTGKVDRGQIAEDTWFDGGLSEEIVFKYKSDSNDKKVENRGDIYWDGIHDEYPYKEVLGGGFRRGLTTFENPFFAGTYQTLSFHHHINGAYVPTLWGECESGQMPTGGSGCRPIQGHNFLPRLLGWYRFQCDDDSGSALVSGSARITIWGTNTQQFISSLNAVASPNMDFHSFPQAVSYNKINRDYPVAQSLTYGSVWTRYYDCTSSSIYINQSMKGLYQNYYQKMIEMLKVNSRIKSVLVDLKITDIIDLDFRRLVYIDGVYWRINRVIDYQPNNNEATKVELIQFSFLGDYDSETAFPIDNTIT